MATMQSFLRRNHGDMDASDTVIYGPSTSNQVSVLQYALFQHHSSSNFVLVHTRIK